MTGVWLRPPRSPRAEPPLNRERIAQAAVAVLDRDGVAGLTMRRLAEHLDAGATTLYWHVKTKDDIIDLALDEIFGEVALPPAGADWQQAVRELLTAWHATMLRHPWSAALIGRPLLGPNVLSRTERLQATLVTAGFAEPHLTAATHALANYVIGSALTRATWQQATHAADRDAVRQRLAEQRADFPTLADHGHFDDRDEDVLFDQGLTYLLDGVCASAG